MVWSPPPAREGRGLAFITVFGIGKPTNTLSLHVSEKSHLLLGLSGICACGHACISDPQLDLTELVWKDFANPIFELATTRPASAIEEDDHRMVVHVWLQPFEKMTHLIVPLDRWLCRSLLAIVERICAEDEGARLLLALALQLASHLGSLGRLEDIAEFPTLLIHIRQGKLARVRTCANRLEFKSRLSHATNLFPDFLLRFALLLRSVQGARLHWRGGRACLAMVTIFTLCHCGNLFALP